MDFRCISATCILLLVSVINTIDGSEEAKCEQVLQIHNDTQQCPFVKATDDCTTDGGYINYIRVLFCTFQGNDLRPLGFVVFALWFLYLLLATAVTSDRFFAPNLPVIADALHLSENVAGETLLALGNGAPDFFTSLVAAMSMKDGDAGILYGTLLGSGTFVTTVIVATIVAIRPFHTMQRPILKDIAFYMTAVFCAFSTLWDGRIYLWEACMFLVIYVAYLITVFSGPYMNKLMIHLLKKKKLAKASKHTPVSNVVGQLLLSLVPTSPARTAEPAVNVRRSGAFDPITMLRDASAARRRSDDAQSSRTRSIIGSRQEIDNPSFIADEKITNVATTISSHDNRNVSVEKEQKGADARQSVKEEVLPHAVDFHGILNRERVMLAFASGLRRSDDQLAHPSGVNLHRPILRLHSKSTTETETANVATKSIAAKLHQPGRRQSAWSANRFGRNSPAVSAGSQSRRSSGGKITPLGDGTIGQSSPMLPRSAKLMLRRASARLNESISSRYTLPSDDDIINSDEEAPSESTDNSLATSMKAQPKLRARVKSTLHAFPEDEDMSDDNRSASEMQMKTNRFPARSNIAVDQSNGSVFVVPVSPQFPTSANEAPHPLPMERQFRQRAKTMSESVRHYHNEMVPRPKSVHLTDNGIDLQGPSSRAVSDLGMVTPLDINQEAAATNPENKPNEKQEDIDIVEDKPYWKWLLQGYNPIEIDEWETQSWFGKLVQILKAPIILIMLITNPVLDEDMPMYGWNRPVNTLHCIISPVFIILAIVQFDFMLGGKFPLIVLLAIIGLGGAAAVFFTSKNTERPKYHLVFAAIGFVTTVIWIYVLANEIVNLLQCFGLALGISQSILGLTCLAWGNSLGDLLNNILIAKQGYSKMAISSCFGGMLFNLLLGLGVPLLIVTAKNGGVVEIEQSNVLTVLFGFLGLELVSSFIAIPLIQGFYVRRPYAIYLYCIYACCIIFAVLTEVDVISPNIFGYAHVPISR